jgi:hypothetical protein
VLVGVDDATGRAFARVVFFGAFSAAVDFGELVERVPSRSVLIDIAPLAKAAPDDIMETAFAGSVGPVAREELRPRASNHDEFERRMSELLRAIYRRHRTELAKSTADSFNGLRTFRQDEREQKAFALLEPIRQVFLNLMQTAIPLVLEHVSGLDDDLRSALERHIEADPSNESGLSVTALATVNRLHIAFSRQLVRDLESAMISDIDVAALFWGEHGVGLATIELLAVAGPAFGVVDVDGLRETFVAARREYVAKTVAATP